MTSARDLTIRLADLLRRERGALADFLVALADFDRQRRWLELGHASLFYYLHRELGLSKGAAFYRKTAAELIQRFPDVIEPLRDGRLCLTSIVELAKVLTPENREEVLPRFFQLSKQEAKAVSAALRPDEAAPHRDVVTAVGVPVIAAGPVARGLEARALVAPAWADRDRAEEAVHPDEPRRANFPWTAERDPGRAEESVHPDEPRRANSPHASQNEPQRDALQARPSTAEPLTADLSRLHVTVSRRFLEKLEAARAALSHARPGAGAEEILEAGLDLLLERQAKRKGAVAKPRREPPPSKMEHVPAHVIRAVWERDGGRCQWPVDSGGICGSTHQVELDHVVPRARGGPSTVMYCRLLCRIHNDLAARQIYGDAWMDRFTRRGATAPTQRDEAPATAPAPA